MQRVVGIGTGRCGSKSLARFLGSQHNSCVTHEMRPILDWYPSDAERILVARNRVSLFSKRPCSGISGDVASYYLPYLSQMLLEDSKLKVIWLVRPRSEVIESFKNWLEVSEPLQVNHWTSQTWERGKLQRFHHNMFWSRAFPKYENVDLDVGIGRYWDEYHSNCELLIREFPGRFLTVETKALNETETQRSILEFCKVDQADMVFQGFVENRTVDRAPVRSRRSSSIPNSNDLCVVLVPFYNSVPEHCESGLRELERQGYHVRRFRIHGDEDVIRNTMLTKVLLEGYQETLWIDPRTRFHPESVNVLRSHGFDLSCAPVFTRYPTDPMHLPLSGDRIRFGQDGDIVELELAGTMFLHVRRYVYDEMVRSKIVMPCTTTGGADFLPFFVSRMNRVAETWVYENASQPFCSMARASGFRIFADCRLRVWNIEDYPYGWEDSGGQVKSEVRFHGHIG